MLANKCSAKTNKAIESIMAEVSAKEATDAYCIDGILPKAVVFPTSLQELSRTLEIACQNSLAVAPWGGGTRTIIGNKVERLDLVVDLSRFSKILEHNPDDLTATVEAGITIDELQGTLAKHGQFVALDPPLPNRATVGGTLAVGTSGPLKWQYNSPRDVVIGMKVAHPDGRVTKSGGQVVKNVSGYDMARLHIGGLGTLGVIAEVSLKLTPLPDSQSTLIVSYNNRHQCLAAGLSIFHSDIIPLALTTFDSTAKNRMNLADIEGCYFLAIRLGGRPKTLSRQINECQLICNSFEPTAVRSLSETGARRTWRSLADFGWDTSTTPVLGMGATVPPAEVPELLDSLQQLNNDNNLSPAIVSHPAHGSVLVRWFARHNLPEARLLSKIAEDARVAAIQVGGHMTIEQCPNEVKSNFDIWCDTGTSLGIMRRLKKQYDQKGTLNLGRFVGHI